MRSKILIKNITEVKLRPTRRIGLYERRLVTPEDSPHHNIVHFEIDQGAEVEFHEIQQSESLFFLKGSFEAVLEDLTEILEPGTVIYFPPQSSHGLRCIRGPGQFLAIFAPVTKNI